MDFELTIRLLESTINEDSFMGSASVQADL